MASHASYAWWRSGGRPRRGAKRGDPRLEEGLLCGGAGRAIRWLAAAGDAGCIMPRPAPRPPTCSMEYGAAAAPADRPQRVSARVRDCPVKPLEPAPSQHPVSALPPLEPAPSQRPVSALPATSLDRELTTTTASSATWAGPNAGTCTCLRRCSPRVGRGSTCTSCYRAAASPTW